MRNLILIVAALGMTILLGASPGEAAGAGSYLRLPEAVQTLKPNVQLVSYKYCDYNGCYRCQYRECDDYYYCGYGYSRHKCCRHFSYSDCSGYGGGGGGYEYHHRHHYQGGGGY